MRRSRILKKVSLINMTKRFKAWDKRGFWIEDFIIGSDGTVRCDGSASRLKYDGVHETEVVLVQSLGFLDSRGKEIFEGDIVRIGANVYEGGYFDVLIEDIYSFKLVRDYDRSVDPINRPEYEDIVNVLLMKYGQQERPMQAIRRDEDRKIIGNIFENPELIK